MSVILSEHLLIGILRYDAAVGDARRRGEGPDPEIVAPEEGVLLKLFIDHDVELCLRQGTACRGCRAFLRIASPE